MNALKRNKALGSSWLTPEILRCHSHEGIYSALAAILNEVGRSGMPPEWNVLSVTSIHKKGDKGVAGNYRGISVMSALPKVLA